MDTVSIVIVSWNTRGYLQQCLASIYLCNPACVREIIVVDNASTDGSPEMVAAQFPEVILIQARSNLGFARANNLALAVATGSLAALVNSDALVHCGCLEALVADLSTHPKVGLVGPRVNGPDGLLQRTCRKFPTLWNTTCRTLALDRLMPDSRWFGGYELPERAHARRREVEVLSGCFCVARMSAIDAIGALDERFFFYGEDIDWCKRFANGGWKVAFVPAAEATHFGGASTSKEPVHYSVQILRATLQYWEKHHGRGGRILCRALLIAHHGLRLAARASLGLVGAARTDAWRAKQHEDAVCLRWLSTAAPAPPKPLDRPVAVGHE